jgi:uncharacterized membrane protein
MGGVFMILIVGLIIWAIVSAVRPERATTQSPAPRALEVLADRYARGEIDGQEYRNAKATIEGSL